AFARRQARDVLVDGHARRLPFDAECLRIEIVPCWRFRPRMKRQIRCFERIARKTSAAGEARPTILPHDVLNRGFAAQNRTAVRQRPTAQMREGPTAVAMLYERSMPRGLEAQFRITRARDERIARHDFVRALDRA